jgi:hypothetical protein
MKTLEERRNLPKLLFSRLILKFDLVSVTSQVELTGPVVVALCQLQDGSRTITSVVQYAFMVLVYPGGKGTRYSN